ncbi:MAG: endolytic transglycosylase MltG [Propionibacteriaceae bacterium]|nr:endolytic transglycosylase MltG [Propionibacteriaceae bacterium]
MKDSNETSWIAPEGARRAKSALAVSLSFLILLTGIAVVSWKGFGFYMDWRQQDDYIGSGEEPIEFIVNPGEGWAIVADSLVAADVIRDPSLFEREALRLNDGPQPGTWKLLTKLPARTAAELLNDRANQVYIKFTVKEGTRVADIFPLMIEELGMTQEQIDESMEKVMEDPTQINVKVAIKDRLEGVLFPDTYLLYPPMDTEDPAGVLSRMALQFNTVLKELEFEKKAQELGISTYDAVIVASIIEAEVNRDEYRAQVAQVIYNRLDRGMKLQMDTTVNYGMNRSGYANLDNAALQTDTPYNSYLHEGLPPTPISLPGKKALEAAVNPVHNNYLYWVTVNLETGETRFAENDSQHQANVRVYQQWCRANPDICK